MSDSAKKIYLMIIDPQVDFVNPKGALPVGGAVADMDRLALFITKMKKRVKKIRVTLDSHHRMDISQPMWFRDSSGKHPDPYTAISADDLIKGTWTTFHRAAYARTLAYLRALETGKRYVHRIWPEHCLIGTPGQCVTPVINEALSAWVDETSGWIYYTTKGSNPYTEHFGAVQAEVPDPEDPTTQLNVEIMDDMAEADIILLSGEAGSHCLATTGLDIMKNFKDPAMVGKLVLLSDATSPVGGFENLQADFITALTAKGMKVTTTDQFLRTI